MQYQKIIPLKESPISLKTDKISGSDITHMFPLLKETEVKIIEKENKIFIRKKIDDSWYETLFENSNDFFRKMMTTRKRTAFSSLDRSFKPNENDWKFIKTYSNMVYVMITSKCNMQCKVCFAQDTLKPEEMNTEDIKYIISKVGRNKKFMFFGLEPTTRDDLPEMIKLVKNSGNIPTLFTNGLKLSDSEYIKKLKTAGLKEVFFSFDGFKNIYQKLGSENSYNLKMKALQNLKNNKLFTFIAFVLMDNINEDEIEKIIPFLIKNSDFIKGLFLVPLSPFGRLEILQKKYFTYSDIIKKIVESKHTGCKEDYFFEFEKFKINLHKFLIKFRKNISTGSQIITVPFKIKDKLIKEALDLKDLKEINSALENGNIWHLLKYASFMVHFLRFLLNSTKFYYKNLNKNLIYISLYQITTDLNYLPFWTHSIGIIKQKDNAGQNEFFFNCI